MPVGDTQRLVCLAFKYVFTAFLLFLFSTWLVWFLVPRLQNKQMKSEMEQRSAKLKEAGKMYLCEWGWVHAYTSGRITWHNGIPVG